MATAPDLLDHAAEHRRLPQRARPRLAQREHDALVEGRRLVQRLLQRLPPPPPPPRAPPTSPARRAAPTPAGLPPLPEGCGATRSEGGRADEAALARREPRDLVEVVVEALVELEVLDDAGQEDEVVEALSHGVLEAGREYPRARVEGVVAPPVTRGRAALGEQSS